MLSYMNFAKNMSSVLIIHNALKRKTLQNIVNSPCVEQNPWIPAPGC